MNQILQLSDFDRSLISNLTVEMKRHNDLMAEQREERVYSNKEAAAILGKCESTICLWVKSGRLKRSIRNNRSGIPQSEIDKELTRINH